MGRRGGVCLRDVGARAEPLLSPPTPPRSRAPHLREARGPCRLRASLRLCQTERRSPGCTRPSVACLLMSKRRNETRAGTTCDVFGRGVTSASRPDARVLRAVIARRLVCRCHLEHLVPHTSRRGEWGVGGCRVPSRSRCVEPRVVHDKDCPPHSPQLPEPSPPPLWGACTPQLVKILPSGFREDPPLIPDRPPCLTSFSSHPPPPPGEASARARRVSLAQGWGASSPRALSGPQSHLVWLCQALG